MPRKKPAVYESKGLITHLAFYAGRPCAVKSGRIANDRFEPK
jgi:hypothetical protein